MSKQQSILKAVFPVAGLGTRFLPATKAAPKEMLPVVDKPLIQYAVEEAYSAGVRHIEEALAGIAKADRCQGHKDEPKQSGLLNRLLNR